MLKSNKHCRRTVHVPVEVALFKDYHNPCDLHFKCIGFQNNGAHASRNHWERSQHEYTFCYNDRNVKTIQGPAITHVYRVSMWKQRSSCHREIRVGPDGFNATTRLWKLYNVEIWRENKHIGAGGSGRAHTAWHWLQRIRWETYCNPVSLPPLPLCGFTVLRGS